MDDTFADSCWFGCCTVQNLRDISSIPPKMRVTKFVDLLQGAIESWNIFWLDIHFRIVTTMIDSAHPGSGSGNGLPAKLSREHHQFSIPFTIFYQCQWPLMAVPLGWHPQKHASAGSTWGAGRPRGICLGSLEIQCNQRRHGQNWNKNSDCRPHVEASWNRGTAKSSIFMGFSIMNHIFWG